MRDHIKSYVTTGVAIVGASVIAVTPIAPQSHDIAKPVRTQNVSLLADAQTQAVPSGGFAELVQYINDLQAPVPPQDVPANERAIYLAAAFTASGLRLTKAVGLVPVGLFEVGAAYLQGIDAGNAALAQFIVNSVDGPLWVADPVLYGLRDTYGGPGVETFRNMIWQSTQTINTFLLNLLHLPDPEAPAQNLLAADVQSGNALDAPASIDFGSVLQQVWQATLTAATQPGPVAYQPVTGPTGISSLDDLLRIGEGVAATGIRFATALAEFPFGVVQVLASVLSPDFKQVLSNFIANTVDGPLWVADPFLYGLRDVVDGAPGGPVETFRDSIWEVTQHINAGIQNLLNLPPDQASSSGADSSLAAKQQSVVATQKQDDVTQQQLAGSDNNVVVADDAVNNTKLGNSDSTKKFKLDGLFNNKDRQRNRGGKSAPSAAPGASADANGLGAAAETDNVTPGEQNGNDTGGKTHNAKTGSAIGGKHRRAG
ncbi:MAG TPA: hypothetical protein VH496_18255 [Mycobacterium sp.]|jgi:hypothetical protein